MVTPTYSQYYQPQYPQYSQPSQVLAWIQSEEEAVRFPLSAGQSVFLMNQNDDYLYMKFVDQLGRTTFIKKRLIDESAPEEVGPDMSGYLRKDEFEAMLNERIQTEVEKRVSELSFKAKATKSRRRSTSDEV